MEQNEQIKDNGFEAFEDQDKYISIEKKIEERADKYAKVSQYILIVEAIELCAGIVLPAEFLKAPYIYDVIGITVIVVFVTHIISLGCAIMGNRIKKTKKIKELLFLHKIIPVVTLITMLIFLWMAYLLCATITSISEEPISFFEFLMDLAYSILS